MRERKKTCVLIASIRQTRSTAVQCIGRLLNDIDKMIIVDEILPFLTDIQSSDAEIIMAVIGNSTVCISRPYIAAGGSFQLAFVVI